MVNKVFVSALSYTYAAVNKCVFKADLTESSEVLQVTLDGSAFHTYITAWTNAQSPALLRDLGTTRGSESTDRRCLAGF